MYQKIKMARFNFQDYRQLTRTKRTLIRFVIYGFVLFFLLYLIDRKSESKQTTEQDELEYFEVVLD